MVGIDQTDENDIYRNMKEAMRKVKGVLSMGNKEEVKKTYIGQGCEEREGRHGGYEYDENGRKIYTERGKSRNR